MKLFAAVLSQAYAIMASALQTTAKPDHSVVVRPNCTEVIRQCPGPSSNAVNSNHALAAVLLDSSHVCRRHDD